MKVNNEILIQWLGTAFFKIEFDGWSCLLDPYFSRNPYAHPKVRVDLEDITKANCAFISHGHFDHIANLPVITKLNQNIKIFAPKTASKNIMRDCESRCNVERVYPNNIYNIKNNIEVSSLESSHVHFDMKLIWNTLVRALRFKHTKNYVNRGLLTKYPCGETYSYLINLDGYKILFMGSAGLDHQRLREWAKLEVDCLLVPVQGNSKICEIAAEITEILKPKIVIPQHFDDFYPPISQFVDISSFKERIKNSLPLTTVNELQVSKRYLISRQGLRLTNDRDYLKDAVAAG